MADSAILSMEITGGEKITLMLQGLERRAKDLRPVWGYVSSDFRAIEERQFSTEGSLGGGWPALSSRYAEWKATFYPGAKILELTGALRNSLASAGSGNIDERQPDFVRLGTSVPYAKYHQTGTRRMPRRPPIVVTEETKKRWTKAIHSFLVRGDLLGTTNTSIFGE